MTLWLRVSKEAEAADWHERLQRSRAHYEQLHRAPSLPDQLLLLACRRADSFSFPFCEFKNEKAMLAVAGALLLELYLTGKVRIVRPDRLYPASESQDPLGVALLDDLLFLVRCLRLFGSRSRSR